MPLVRRSPPARFRRDLAPGSGLDRGIQDITPGRLPAELS
jgi:hypothetical protein